MSSKSPPAPYIGVFDSGVGGLNVVEKLMRYLPRESILYYGDTARCPYGDKPQETIVGYSLDNLDFLMRHPLKAVVVACGTATACAWPLLQAHSTVPIISVAQKSVIKHALSRTKAQRIIVLATARTIASGYYQKMVGELMPCATVYPVACPQWVPLIEAEAPVERLQEAVREALQPLRGQDVDTVLLGCTHYPYVANLIQRELPRAVVVDLADSAAQAVLETLLVKGALYAGEEPPRHNTIFSGATPPLARRFLEETERVSV